MPSACVGVCLSLHSLADMLTVSVLKDLCEARVRKGLTVATAAELLVACDSHASSVVFPLRAQVLRFIVAHFDAVSKTKGFSLLTKAQMLEVLSSR